MLRHRLWLWLRRNHPEGEILSRPLLCLRALLYPVVTLAWCLNRSHGYDLSSDTLRINGVRFSMQSLVNLTYAQGEMFTVIRERNILIIEEVKWPRHQKVE